MKVIACSPCSKWKHRYSIVAGARSKGFGAAPPPTPPKKKQRHAQSVQELKLCAEVKSKDSSPIGDKLHDKLGACSVVFVGDDTDLNRRVAEQYATVSGYSPLHTSAIIKDVTGNDIETLEKEDGRDAVVIVEASVLEQLSLQLRCSISTLGTWGAAARAPCWRHLYGAFTCWLDVTPEESEEQAPQRGAYSEAEVHLKLNREDLEEESMETTSENVTAQVILALMERVKEDKKLPDGKRLYVKLGCRGDWPDIQPPEWQPPEPSVNAS